MIELGEKSKGYQKDTNMCFPERKTEIATMYTKLMLTDSQKYAKENKPGWHFIPSNWGKSQIIG